MTTETSIYEYVKSGSEPFRDKVALWFYGKSITYSELFYKIDNAADNLYALGVKEGTVVTIHLPNCPQAVTAVYAVAKLGGICNMVHPQMPIEALRKNMAFTESDVLITSGETDAAELRDVNLLIRTAISDEDSDFDKKTADFGGIWFHELTERSTVSADMPSAETLASRCAVYMSSSGTTGTAKTVMMSHGAANRLVGNVNKLFYDEVLSDQTALSVAPLCHVFGFLADMHRTISCGAKVVIMHRWNRQSAIRLIESQAVNFMTGVPSMYLDLLRGSDLSGRIASGLRYCFIGGDAVSQELIEAIDERVGKRVAFSVYGMTETGPVACGSPYHDRKNASCYPFKDTVISVINDNGELSSVGRGEIVISSSGIMLGYLKDRQATEQAMFTKNGRTWIHTGDYGEVDEDGFMYFIARLKNIIKRKGHCVFPDDVENIISTVPLVDEVCVIGIPDSEDQTDKVCAAVVLKTGAQKDIAEEDIMACCRRELPRYSVPAVLVFVEKIPRKGIGKTDREVLRKQICLNNLPF